jgi:aminodeoxychorismate synthase component I
MSMHGVLLDSASNMFADDVISMVNVKYPVKMINLSKTNFLAGMQCGGIPPLFAEIDFLDPFIVYKAFRERKNSIFLDSAKGNCKIARFSFIIFDPYLIFKLKDGELEIEDCLTGRKTVSFRNPIERLKELLTAYPQKRMEALPPFHGGAVGFFSYDFARYIEKLPAHAVDDLGVPDAHFMLFDKTICFDLELKKAWIVCAPGASHTCLGYRPLTDIDWSAAYDESKDAILRISDQLARMPQEAVVEAPCISTSAPHYEMSKEQYMDIVKQAKEYIAAGDIFQANLSQRISADIGDANPWQLYQVLRRVNPSPFAAYADFGDYQIAGSSPERLIDVRSGTIETRPIAGTRPRGRDLDEDSEMRSELLLNEKERAEHIMLIDLERNDIGRVSKYGSVAVDELMITEDYSHVIHIVSNVKGRLNNEMSCLDAVKATFPGGTITGVPKVRCMEIIDELEPVRRGVYTGSLGYIGFSGDMDLNIIIRTFVIKNGRAYIQAGAGIVADSDPEREYYETLKKAEALIRTLNNQSVNPINNR